MERIEIPEITHYYSQPTFEKHTEIAHGESTVFSTNGATEN